MPDKPFSLARTVVLPSAIRAVVIFLLAGLMPEAVQGRQIQQDPVRIQPYPANPFYWQYQEHPVMLLGGSDDDNLFQWKGAELIDHLDLMREIGANYVRNSMSARDEGNVQPFRLVDGRYDLDQWNDEYWNRFETLLRETFQRDIIVQIELWDLHDFYAGYARNAWHPDLNRQLTPENTRLRTESYGDHWETQHDFFLSVPDINNDSLLLRYQQRFIDQLLSISFNYPNVLYCIDNEIFTQYPLEWGYYWRDYLKARADEAGREIEVAEMYQNHDVRHEQHRATLDHPEIFDFVDISQNSRQSRQHHWDQLQWVRQYLSDHPRPINHTKTYGGPRGEWTDGPDHGIQRFWRNIIGGAASTRFHRPPSGIGLSNQAQRHIRSARMVADAFDLFRAAPDAGSELLSDREDNEAFLSYIAGEQYLVYFPDGGDVHLDLSDVSGTFTARWLNIEGGNWFRTEVVNGGERVRLHIPYGGHWIALLDRDGTR